MSLLSHIPLEAQDPIYGLQVAIKEDLRKEKSNLSIGILINQDGSLKKFEAVSKAEEVLFGHETKEYMPIDGFTGLRKAASELLLSKHMSSYTAQTVGGTGALFVAGIFIRKFLTPHILIPEPTWINHRKLFESCGLTVSAYSHKALDSGVLDIHPIIEAIKNAPERSICLLQASCHNPTGIDPTMDQWQQISLLLLEKKIIPFFDLAYQGLGNGLAEDVLSLELFTRDGHELLIANSMAKNFGIYSDRVGTLTIATKGDLDAISSQIRKIIRCTYSSPPAHGARVVAHILTSLHLRTLWEEELQAVRNAIGLKRKLFSQKLQDFHQRELAAAVKHSCGLFSLLDISKEKIMQLRNDGIYLADDGRINIAALNEPIMEKIAKKVKM